jgi:hypothetical protein
MSIQVWCYECDEYVEGWELLDQFKEKLSEIDGSASAVISGPMDLEIDIENTPTNGFKSRITGAGNNS